MTAFKLIIVLTVALLNVSAEAAVIRLHRDVMVDRPLITLGDVAEVVGEDDAEVERLKEITLQPAPVPGQQVKIAFDTITSRLRAHQVDLTRIEVTGRSLVVVKREADRLISPPTRVIASSFVEPRLAAPVQPRVINDHPELKLGTSQLRYAEGRIVQAIRDHLASTSPDWGQPRIFVPLPPSSALKVLQATADGLEITDSQLIREDRFEFTFTIKAEDRTTDTVNVVATITRRPRVLAAKFPIASGQKLSASDLAWNEVDDIRNGVTDIERLVGKEARRPFKAGDIIKEEHVTEATLIKRGEPVAVVCEVNGCRSTMVYRAKNNGRLGEIIPVETEDRRQALSVRVTGVRTADTLDSQPDKGGLKIEVRPDVTRQNLASLTRTAAANQQVASPIPASKGSPLALRRQ